MRSVHLRYAIYLVKHKAFVFRAGLTTGAPIFRLLIHDWSKFSVAEWSPYVTRFYGAKEDQDRDKFQRAWLHHLHRNAHHWQHHLSVDGKQTPLRMPEKIVREMVADWMGAGRTQTGRWEVHEWYENNKARIILHEDTRALVEEILNGKAEEKT